MITLSSQYVTTAVSTINGVATTTTTDHLKVSGGFSQRSGGVRA